MVNMVNVNVQCKLKNCRTKVQWTNGRTKRGGSVEIIDAIEKEAIRKGRYWKSRFKYEHITLARDALSDALSDAEKK